MPFPKLSQLQSRLTASLTASIILLLIYFTISSPNFAYAAEVESTRPEDHNHNNNRLAHAIIFQDEEEDLELQENQYESQFFGFDRSIVGRAATGDPTNLTNNMVVNTNIVMGESMYYVFSKSEVWGDVDASINNLPSPVKLHKRSQESNTTSLYEPKDSWVADDSVETGEERAELRVRKETDENRDTDHARRDVYVTINTCLMPDSDDTSLFPPKELELYISTTEDNQKPGPNVTNAEQVIVVLDGGAGSVVVNTTGNVYIGIYAPKNTGFTGIYNAEIAASIDGPYHYYNSSTPNLFLIDSDNQAALLVTNNLTHESPNSTVYKEWMNLSPPFVMFAANQNKTSILGVQNSYCGLEKYADIMGTKGGVRTNMVQYSMTNRGIENLPKQQFYFTGLNSSSDYYGILAMTGNSTKAADGIAGSGSKVWKTMNFSTIANDNCAVIFNLSFCDQVAYAVPSNPNTFPDFNSLAAVYDNNTQAMYENFNYSLQQVPCNITSSGQYSLAKNCDDCAAAYKQWLCSVSMPRCTDFEKQSSWLQARNILQAFPNGTKLPTTYTSLRANVQYLNGSRNPIIDTQIAPGPYKEVLPCADLCYDLVQSCPASFGFGCPQPGMLGFNQSYGLRADSTQEQFGQITCNYPGAAFYLSGASTIMGNVWSEVGLWMVAAIGVGVGATLWL